MLQSPDLVKVKEELSRLQKRLKAGTKLVEEKRKLHKEQSQLSAKLQADLENVTDGEIHPSLTSAGRNYLQVLVDSVGCTAAGVGMTSIAVLSQSTLCHEPVPVRFLCVHPGTLL